VPSTNLAPRSQPRAYEQVSDTMANMTEAQKRESIVGKSTINHTESLYQTTHQDPKKVIVKSSNDDGDSLVDEERKMERNL
jgi:hypothetical protein